MAANEGMFDRLFRFVSGVMFVLFGVSGLAGPGWSIAFDLIGALLLVTAAFGFCPLYRVLGIDTLPRKT